MIKLHLMFFFHFVPRTRYSSFLLFLPPIFPARIMILLKPWDEVCIKCANKGREIWTHRESRKKIYFPFFFWKKVLHENIVSYTGTVKKYMVLGITSLFWGTPGLISFFLCFPFFSPCLREYERGSSGVYRLLASRGKYVCKKIIKVQARIFTFTANSTAV